MGSRENKKTKIEKIGKTGVVWCSQPPPLKTQYLVQKVIVHQKKTSKTGLPSDHLKRSKSHSSPKRLPLVLKTGFPFTLKLKASYFSKDFNDFIISSIDGLLSSP